MKNIEVAILNPSAIKEAEKMAVAAARLTQRAEKIASMEDFMKLYNAPWKEDSNRMLRNLCKMPHPTLQKFGVINVVITGASRRFLAQITRHQNETKFMSGSLQYSDYSSDNNKTDFVVPYSMLGTEEEKKYLESCKEQYKMYEKIVVNGKELGWEDAGDVAGYAMPQGLRNVLIISATPFQWKHMIGQRVCNRNTKETQYVMLKIWELLKKESPNLFGRVYWGCLGSVCQESKGMSCGHALVKKNDFTFDDKIRAFNRLNEIYGEEMAQAGGDTAKIARIEKNLEAAKQEVEDYAKCGYVPMGPEDILKMYFPKLM